MIRKKAINTIISLTVSIFLYGCGLTQLEDGSYGIYDDAVASTFVTTSPDGARLSLVNVDISPGASMSSSYAPNKVHFTPLPSYGAYLIVSSPGYKNKTVRLSTGKEKLHVELEKMENKKKKCPALLTFSKAFFDGMNTPDISFVAGEKHVGDLINKTLAVNEVRDIDEDEENCSEGSRPLQTADAAKVTIEKREYKPQTKLYAGKILIVSNPSAAKFLLDGYVVGTTPMEIPVQRGSHRVTLRTAEHEEWSREIAISDREEQMIEVQLVPTSKNVARSGLVDNGNI